MPKTKDYYEVLGVGRQATQKEISTAFRKLARQYHPDANKGDKQAEQKFKEVSEAHDVLRDPENRRLYDAFGKDWQAAKQAGIDPAQAQAGRRRADPGVSGVGGGGSRGEYPTVSPDEFGDLFGEGGGGQPFSDLFGSMFGGGRSARRGAATAPVEPLEAEGTIQISLQEAFQGTARTMELPDGRKLEVKVPAGVADQTVLRVPGLRVKVEVQPHPTFVREGNDLRVPVWVPLRVAMFGGEVEVPTLKGTRVKLTVKPETQNLTRLRLRGLGMPDPKGGSPGDLHAEVRVRLPFPLTPELRKWTEQMPESG